FLGICGHPTDKYQGEAETGKAEAGKRPMPMSGSIEKERQKPRADAKHDGKQKRGKAALQRNNNTIEQERKGCLWRKA
ncbi:MAG: hypothetical protein K1W40_00105, partial [Schaedlerella sp.]|uniref:hypothetical protein n=1 Tax=Schaedlerella sp. TaxID=2676057 RepID=UPI0035296F0F